jgi:hypothetical protein
MKPTEDKQTKRYQAEEANCRRQERGNLEMGQCATRLISSLKILMGTQFWSTNSIGALGSPVPHLTITTSHRPSSTAWAGGGSVGYNQSLRVTAAMAAGVTGKLWSLTDMVQVIEDFERVAEDHRGPCCRAKGEIDLCGFS